MIWFLIALPGLVFAYAIVLRPLLHKIPAMKKFWAEADGFWAKAWALCGRSVTVLWGYILGGIGVAFSGFDKLAQAIGAPDIDIQTKVKDALADHPQIVGWLMLGISLITIWARVRTIGAAVSAVAAPAPASAPASLMADPAPLPAAAPGIVPTPVPGLGPNG